MFESDNCQSKFQSKTHFCEPTNEATKTNCNRVIGNSEIAKQNDYAEKLRRWTLKVSQKKNITSRKRPASRVFINIKGHMQEVEEASTAVLNFRYKIRILRVCFKCLEIFTGT